MRRYEIPKTNAYHDGTRYHCYNINCFTENAELKEIDRITTGKISVYLPVLKCSECGATYFGLITSNEEIKQESKAYAEQQKKAEEERAQIAKQDEAEAIATIRKQEAKQEQALREEIEIHEAKQNGDIILPNILTV